MTARPVDIVVIGSMYYDGHQLTDQRLARALARSGNRVVYVEPGIKPIARKHATSQGRPARIGLSIADGVDVFTPVALPLNGRRVMGSLSATLVFLQLLTVLRSALRPTTRFIVFSGHPELMRWIRRRPHVYVVKDDYVSGADLIGAQASVVAARRQLALGRSRRVVAVSDSLRSTLQRQGIAARVISPGVDPAPPITQEPALVESIGRPRALFIGMMSARIDLKFVSRVAECGWQVVFVGGLQPTMSSSVELDRLRQDPGVVMLGWQPPETVVRIAQWCDVGLLPYTLSEFNRSSSPLKLLEYLSAGLPVISTRLPSVEESEAPGVYIVDSLDQLDDTLRSLRPDSTARPATSSLSEFANRQSWDARAQEYLSVFANPASDESHT